MTTNQSRPIGSIQEQAGYWIVRQNSGDWNAKDELAFRHWLAESPENYQAFQQVKALWQGLDQFKPQLIPTETGVQPQPSKVRFNRWRSIRRYVSLAGVVFLIFNLKIAYLVPSETHFKTDMGQHASFTLADGSEVSLNTDSEVRVSYSPIRRSITLMHGEAKFNVAHEIWRGFSVSTTGGKIIDIGTTFNVYQDFDHVEVTVLAGAIRVETLKEHSPVLYAGQRLMFSFDGVLSAPDQPDMAALTAWEQGQMIFDMTPLNQVTAQLMRYHTVKIVFDDPKLKQLKMSGTFKTEDLGLFLSTLESIYPLRAVKGSDQVVHLKADTKG